jgi:hypothetical protein
MTPKVGNKMLQHISLHKQQMNLTSLACWSAAGIAYILMCVIASMHYPGSIVLYVLFTFSSALMLWFSICQRAGYGQMILGIFLWLGIWFKLSAHMVFGYAYIEATGEFTYDPAQFDELLVVATVATLAVCSAWFLFKAYLGKDGANIQSSFSRIGKYIGSKTGINMRFIIVGIALLVLLVNAINLIGGILNVGLVPRTVLFWPGNAVISWLLGCGFSFMIATMLFWSLLQGQKLNAGLWLVIFEGMISSMTMLSRGTYLWHVLPIVCVVWLNKSQLRDMLSRRVLWGFSAIAIFALVVNGAVVNHARDYFYNPQAEQTSQADQGDRGNQHSQANQGNQASQAVIANVGRGLSRLSGLVADRWLGVEGLMAAVGYSQKSVDLWTDLLVEKNAIGYVTRYQLISKSQYVGVDTSKFQFGTVPGPAGFFYLSGSLLLVFAGMFLLALLVVVIEYWVLVMTHNPFLCAVIGVWLANSVAQFGLAPRQQLFQLFINLLAVLLIAFVPDAVL